MVVDRGQAFHTEARKALCRAQAVGLLGQFRIIVDGPELAVECPGVEMKLYSLPCGGLAPQCDRLERKLEIGQIATTSGVQPRQRRIDEQPTDVMPWIEPFDRVGGDIVDRLAD